mmetsp:Transcript_46697/g.129981  ORF Transcript_46697/g.129981 Transcript_46697/m.129981 type:complete len:202 (+) Transcript_46697:1420-2025(+)
MEDSFDLAQQRLCTRSFAVHRRNLHPDLGSAHAAKREIFQTRPQVLFELCLRHVCGLDNLVPREIQNLRGVHEVTENVRLEPPLGDGQSFVKSHEPLGHNGCAVPAFLRPLFEGVVHQPDQPRLQGQELRVHNVDEPQDCRVTVASKVLWPKRPAHRIHRARRRLLDECFERAELFAYENLEGFSQHLQGVVPLPYRGLLE